MLSEQIAALVAAKAMLWRSLDVASVLQESIEAAAKAVGLDTGAIYLLNDNVLYMGAATPALPADFPDELRLANALDHPHIMRAIDTERPVYVQDLRAVELTPQERAVADTRDLRSILYVPLFASDRPIGVFMVGTAAEPRPLGSSTVRISQTLAHSIALALEDAHLFDTLMRETEDLSDDIRKRLTDIAASATSVSSAGALTSADNVQARISQRLRLLEIRDELLRDEALFLPRASMDSRGPLFSSSLLHSESELAAVPDSLQGFSGYYPTEALELGIPLALESLVNRVGVGPEPSSVRVEHLAQMADADTTLLLYRAVCVLLTAASSTPGCVCTEIAVTVDDASNIRLVVAASRAPMSPIRELEGLRDRIRRAGGETHVATALDGSSVTTVALPYFEDAI